MKNVDLFGMLKILVPCLLLMRILAGCTYTEPVPDEQYLLLKLSESATEEDIMSYDLGSSMMIPYLSGFGRYDYTENLASAGRNIVLTLPLVPMQPKSLVLQARVIHGEQDSVLLEVACNESLLGRMQVSHKPGRKAFEIDPAEWNRDVNIVKMEVLSGGSEVEVEGMWLAKNKQVDWGLLQLENRFTGLIAYRDEGAWDEAIHVPDGTTLMIPVRIPSDEAYLEAEVTGGKNGQVHLDMEIVTARAFFKDYPLVSKVEYRDAEEWIPLYWDISERSGRYALCKLKNRGSTAVLIRKLLVSSRAAGESGD